MDTKKVLEKLLKIAENQQKIITKMAQQGGMSPQPMGGATDSWDVKGEVSNALAQIPQARKVRAGIQAATLGPQSGFLDVKVQFPAGTPMESPDANAVLRAIKDLYKPGAQVKGPTGQVATVKQQNVVGIYG